MCGNFIITRSILSSLSTGLMLMNYPGADHVLVARIAELISDELACSHLAVSSHTKSISLLFLFLFFLIHLAFGRHVLFFFLLSSFHCFFVFFTLFSRLSGQKNCHSYDKACIGQRLLATKKRHSYGFGIIT